MFSDTDVHYIAAFLYAAGGKPASVTLGQKVRDAAAKEDRDVDIAMMSTGQIGIVAAEVKNHRRPLDVTVVEQLCIKLSDMPSIRSRAIVSASGYTAPARRKAARHRVKCLTLKRGPLHVFKTVNLPRLTHVKVDDTSWIDGPHISFSFSTDEPLTTAEQAQLRGRKRFNFGSFSLTAEEVKQQMREQFDLGALNLDPTTPVTIDVTAPMTKSAIVKIGRRSLSLAAARFTGVAKRSLYRLPLSSCCYLADEHDEPFAATLIFELGDRLIGVTASAHGFTRRIFHISAAARQKRPVRRRILGGTA